MKKLFASVALLAVAGIAFGAALRVPFFLDNGSSATPPLAQPASGAAGFIGVLNTGTTDLECSVFYAQADGTNRTPVANTFLLQAGVGVSWRPGSTDPDAEGTSIVPNMTGARDLSTGGDSTAFTGPLAGSCTITWTGGAELVVGRYAQNSANASFAYLLPSAS